MSIQNKNETLPLTPTSSSAWTELSLVTDADTVKYAPKEVIVQNPSAQNIYLKLVYRQEGDGGARTGTLSIAGRGMKFKADEGIPFFKIYAKLFSGSTSATVYVTTSKYTEMKD